MGLGMAVSASGSRGSASRSRGGLHLVAGGCLPLGAECVSAFGSRGQYLPHPLSPHPLSTHTPPVDRQTPEKTLPCPKRRLRAVKMSLMHIFRNELNCWEPFTKGRMIKCS